MNIAEKFLENEGIEDLVMALDENGEFIFATDLINKAVKEQLILHGVGSQRELLKAFGEYIDTQYLDRKPIYLEDIDLFLDSL